MDECIQIKPPLIYSMLTHSLRRWPNIATALGDCPVLLGLFHCYAGDASPPLSFPCRQKGHFPDNTIHWKNADVMLGQRLRR